MILAVYGVDFWCFSYGKECVFCAWFHPHALEIRLGLTALVAAYGGLSYRDYRHCQEALLQRGIAMIPYLTAALSSAAAQSYRTRMGDDLGYPARPETRAASDKDANA